MQEFGGTVRFVSENHGDSKLAKQFGVTRYPAIFVDDVLVATPNDFGFYGKGEKETGGRYAPLKSAAAHERFRADLTRMVNLVLAGRKETARKETPHAADSTIASLPAIEVTDLDGKPLSTRNLEGRVVLVEFWATWCPPCRGALSWLGEVKKKYGDRVAVVAVAVESEEAGVRKLTRELNLPVRWVLGTPALARTFGDISAVPTLFVFDPSGKTAAAFYGAPPSLHGDAEAKISALLRGGSAKVSR